METNWEALVGPKGLFAQHLIEGEELLRGEGITVGAAMRVFREIRNSITQKRNLLIGKAMTVGDATADQCQKLIKFGWKTEVQKR